MKSISFVTFTFVISLLSVACGGNGAPNDGKEDDSNLTTNPPTTTTGGCTPGEHRFCSGNAVQFCEPGGAFGVCLVPGEGTPAKGAQRGCNCATGQSGLQEDMDGYSFSLCMENTEHMSCELAQPCTPGTSRDCAAANSGVGLQYCQKEETYAPCLRPVSK